MHCKQLAWKWLFSWKGEGTQVAVTHPLTVNALVAKKCLHLQCLTQAGTLRKVRMFLLSFLRDRFPSTLWHRVMQKGKTLGLSLLLSAYEETRGQPSKTSYPGPATRKAFPTSGKEQVGRIDIYQSVGWCQRSKIIAHIYRELIMARHCPICPHILCYLILTTSDKVGAVQSYPWFTDEETGF